MNRREKLECLLEIQEAIESFENRIELTQESIDGCAGQFRELRDKYTDRIDTYERCIDRLNERFSKRLNTLK
tara:strand:+ start:367 stop:582 length:216 start_codon:yes stop_codon:yes gene_type:complete